MLTLITKQAESLFYDALKKRQLFLSKIDVALIAVSMVTIYSLVCYLLRPVDKGKQYKLSLFFVSNIGAYFHHAHFQLRQQTILYTPLLHTENINPYPTAFLYGNGTVLHFYQQQESSTTKTVHKVINRGLKTYVQSLHTGENFH